ncbi:MAG: tRNA uridine-5-carboxymethylaminomethyl(34) synthesis GTPase MnmE [Rhabdochlamydiaceae bacterium]
MEFIHQPYVPGDTIAAVATPPGEGGIAVIRVSGQKAFDVVSLCFTGAVHSYASHTAHLGKIINQHKEEIDEVLVLVMKGHRSFTGEDTVEISCHGGSLITRKVLDTVIQAGARLARPGEFTFKAFMNGKIDLTKAEAIQSLIHAQNDFALKAAEKQLSGSLAEKISSFQKQLVHIAAHLEAWIDFPEEDLDFLSKQEMLEHLESVKKEMQKLSDTFYEGKILSTEHTLCLVGAPNAGKSSLMNLLLGQDRAIVTDIAGTTRDVLEARLSLNGLNFRLLDTAGLRETEEVIEKEGIRRTYEAVKEADLVLLIIDVTKGICEGVKELLSFLPKNRTVIVWNKKDLARDSSFGVGFPLECFVSVKTGEGIDELKEKIKEIIWVKGLPSKEEIVITNSRHFHLLMKATEHIEVLIKGIREDLSPEFLSSDMKESLKKLGEIIGTNVTEDILSSIFSQFCIGK